MPLSARVLALLKQVHDQAGTPTTGYVLRAPNCKRHRGSNHTWENIPAAAGIPDVRLHDLRPVAARPTPVVPSGDAQQ